MRGAHLPWVLLLAVVAGCGKSTPPTPNPGTGTGETITGRERIGWDQPAANAVELATFRYAIYVDGTRSEVADVMCGTVAGTAGFSCSGRLPPLSAGAHSIEMAAFLSGPTAESERSAALRVMVAAATAGVAQAAWSTGAVELTPDGVALRVERLADGLFDPVDAAFAPDGRLFVAEPLGRIRTFVEGRLEAFDSLSPDGLSESAGVALLSIAVDPRFDRTHFLYALYVTRGSERATVTLARFREVGGRLAERAILAEGVPVPRTDAGGLLRFGPDGKLYLAVGDADEPALDRRASSLAGKLLRLNDDGSTPRDQAGATPMLATGLRSPRGLGWHASGLLWIADEDAGGAGFLAGLTIAEAAPLRVEVRAKQPLGRVRASSTAFYDRPGLPQFANNLFVGSEADRQILRIRFDPDDPGRIARTDPMLKDRVGGVRVVTVGPDGAIYFCTHEALGRLAVYRQ